MKIRVESNRQATKPRLLIWICGAGAVVILYLIIFTSQLHSSINSWNKKPRKHINKDSIVNYGYRGKMLNEPTPSHRKSKPTDKVSPKLKYFTTFDIPEDVELKMVAESYPNIPILFWNNVHKIQRKMFLSNASCAPFPDMYSLELHNTYWQTISMPNKTYVQIYSAFYDKRKDSDRVVKILSMVNKTKMYFPASNHTLYCQLWFENEKQPIIAPVNNLDFVWLDDWAIEDEAFLPYFIDCSIPKSHHDKIPQVVSLVVNPCDKAKNMLRVVYNEASEKKEFAVCVKGLDFLQVDLSSRLIEWMEFLFLMGVDKIFFYELELNSKMRKVLKYYESIGKADLREITLPKGHPNIPFLQHVFLANNNLLQCLDEIIPYNDCFYRNIYSYNYIVLLDIDEIILPQKDDNWHDMIARAKNYYSPEVRINAFTSQHIYFLDRMDKEYPHEDIPLHMHMLQHVYRSQNFTPFNYFVKSILSTNETLSCHNHWPLKVTEGSILHYFKHNEARTQHYRKDCSWEVKCEDYDQKLEKDTRMWNFKNVLIPKVEEAINKIDAFQTDT